MQMLLLEFNNTEIELFLLQIRRVIFNLHGGKIPKTERGGNKKFKKHSIAFRQISINTNKTDDENLNRPNLL